MIILWPLIKERLENFTTSQRMKSAVVSILVLLGVSLNYSNARELAQDMSAEKKYNNRDVLLAMGKKFSGCLGIGEWSHGFNVYGMYEVKLNSYKYAMPSQYGEYSEKLSNLIQNKNAIVISSYPLIAPKASEQLKSLLAPVYFFDIKDNAGVATQFAVYRLSDRKRGADGIECPREPS